jgi:hypothetical protein
MISKINVKVSNIEGAGATFYDMKDNTFDQLIFQNMFGASFSGAGLTYSLERNTVSITVSSERLSVAGVTWQYDSVNTLAWPSYGGSGYTKYTGGVTNADDGFTSAAITLPGVFQMNAQTATANMYVSTNGYITLGSGSGSIITTPSISNPACICGNPSDQWIQSGLTMTDGDVQDIYYKSENLGNGKYSMKLLVYQGTYGSTTTPKSYILNIYRDTTYQWVETRVKLNATGRSGPFNSVDVSQPSSTTSRVWRGDLLGQNWVYLGTGTVI